MMCSNCATLRREISSLRGQLGEQSSNAELRMLQQRLNIHHIPARLLAMMAAASDYVTYERLATVTGPDTQRATIRVHMSHLRRALGAGSVEGIATVGYRLTLAGRQAHAEAMIGARVAIGALNDNENMPLSIAIATMVGRYAQYEGPKEALTVLANISRALEAQYGHA